MMADNGKCTELRCRPGRAGSEVDDRGRGDGSGSVLFLAFTSVDVDIICAFSFFDVIVRTAILADAVCALFTAGVARSLPMAVDGTMRDISRLGIGRDQRGPGAGPVRGFVRWLLGQRAGMFGASRCARPQEARQEDGAKASKSSNRPPYRERLISSRPGAAHALSEQHAHCGARAASRRGAELASR